MLSWGIIFLRPIGVSVEFLSQFFKKLFTKDIKNYFKFFRVKFIKELPQIVAVFKVVKGKSFKIVFVKSLYLLPETIYADAFHAVDGCKKSPIFRFENFIKHRSFDDSV